MLHQGDNNTQVEPFSLSIGLVNYDSSYAELEALIESLLKAVRKLRSRKPGTQIELYLVENRKSNTELAAIIRQYASAFQNISMVVHLIKGHGNIGFGAAHNLIISQLKSKYHLIINPDVLVDQESLLEGISYLQANNLVVMASPYAENKQGEKQFYCKRYPSVCILLIRAFFPDKVKQVFHKHLESYEMRELEETKATQGIALISGCFMLAKTEPLCKVKGFDNRFFLYFEDFDLCIRISKLGDISYLPSMKIKHSGGNSAKKGCKHIGMFCLSAIKYFNLHGWKFYKID